MLTPVRRRILAEFADGDRSHSGAHEPPPAWWFTPDVPEEADKSDEPDGSDNPDMADEPEQSDTADGSDEDRNRLPAAGATPADGSHRADALGCTPVHHGGERLNTAGGDMPEKVRRFKRYLTADEARSLIRTRILAGLPVTAHDIRALGYSLENARWSEYRREVESELGIPHRRTSRSRSTVTVTVAFSERESNSPAPISVLPPGESTHVGDSQMQLPVRAQRHLSHGALSVAKQVFAAIARRSTRALFSLLAHLRAAR